MSESWDAWAREEIISLHKLLVESRAELEALKAAQGDLLAEGWCIFNKPHALLTDPRSTEDAAWDEYLDDIDAHYWDQTKKECLAAGFFAAKVKIVRAAK